MSTPSVLAVVTSASVRLTPRAFAVPLQLSSGVITHITEAQAQVGVRVGRREAVGHGAIYLSDLWAWPNPGLPHEQRDALLRRITSGIANDLPSLTASRRDASPAHPLALGLRLHEAVCEAPGAAARWLGEDQPAPPALAMAMCASPFDAALHDAVGRAVARGALDLYDHDDPIPEADPWLDGAASAEIRGLLDRPARMRFPVWWIVGKHDVMPDAIAAPIRRGVRHFKLKIMGADPTEDADHTARVHAATVALGADDAVFTVDSNEANPDAQSVIDYLDALERLSPEAYRALAYLEQPTGRDIQAHAFDWRDVGQRKPVMLDEGLTSLSLLPEAMRQGWSGLALKTCKGHSFLLVAAAWARRHRLLLSLQDLTNPGLSAIHAALLGSRLPTINGVELNSPQFTPDANAACLPHWAALLTPTTGEHRLPEGDVLGLNLRGAGLA